jgi:hypothetical protein
MTAAVAEAIATADSVLTMVEAAAAAAIRTVDSVLTMAEAAAAATVAAGAELEYAVTMTSTDITVTTTRLP